MSEESSATLARAIRLPHATAMVAGTIIGASIFVQPSEITGQVPSLAGTALVWLVAGALTLLGALVTAELASIFPETGGVYVYLREAFGSWLGFLWGWAMFWVMHSGIIAALAMIFASYVGFLVPLGAVATKGVAVAAILALSAVNYAGVKHGSDLQTAFTAVKVLAILLMVGLGFALGPSPEAGASAPALPDALVGGAAAGMLGGATLSEFLIAVVAGLFAFGGWHMVTYNAEETVAPRRTIPRALAWGVVIVTLCYVLLNAAYFYVLPLETVVRSHRMAADAADVVMGRGGGAAMASLVVFSTFGALAGIVLAGPRVYYAMARDRLLFGWASGLHSRYRTPHRAIVLQAVWASILVITGTYRALFTRVIYTEWIFFGLMALGLFVCRRQAGHQRDYSAWGYPLTPIVFALAAFAIVGNQVISDPVESAVGLGMVAAGLPVYALWARRRQNGGGLIGPVGLRSARQRQ
jgi:APA family basic amino acid/polyamine antiporter